MPRPLRAEEWQALRDLRLRALADAPEAFEMTLARAKEWTDEEWMTRAVATDVGITFVEDGEGGELVGMAFGVFDPATRVAYLRGMFVAPGRSRAGLGRALVEAVESWARTAGATRVELEVNYEMTAAARLYERCGYEPTGRSRPLSRYWGLLNELSA